MSPEASFNEDQIIVSEIEEGVRIENLSGSSNALSENHAGGERREWNSLHSSSLSLGNDIDIPSPLLIHLYEAMNESAAENIEDFNCSEPYPAPLTVSAPPTNQPFPSLVGPMQQEHNFVTVDQADGMNFAFQNQPIMPPNNFHPDNSFQMDTQMIDNQAFSLYDPANNGFGYLPSPNGLPELLDPVGRVQLTPFNHLSESQIGVGIQNNGTNFFDGSANWVNNTYGSQDIQFQQNLDVGMDSQGSFYLGGSTPNQVHFPNVPYNPVGNQGSNFVNNNLPDPGQSSSMMMSNIQTGTTIASELEQEGFYDHTGNYISNRQQKRRLMRNSVYDPMYEAMGLPLDPHLRIFLSQRGHDGLENPAEKTNNEGRNI